MDRLGDFAIELLLPASDAAVFVQAALAIIVIGGLFYRYRSNPDVRLVLIGVSLVLAGLFGVRAIH